jgi:magnesium-transporting ATPase (P-type)
VINVLGKVERYEVEEEFEFTSDRKRMSVVVRNLDSGEYVAQRPWSRAYKRSTR